jgi:hypothetical protein
VALASGSTALYLVIGLFALRALRELHAPGVDIAGGRHHPPGRGRGTSPPERRHQPRDAGDHAPLGGLSRLAGDAGGYVVALARSGWGCATFVLAAAGTPAPAGAGGQAVPAIGGSARRHFHSLAATFVLQFATIAGRSTCKNDLSADFESGYSPAARSRDDAQRLRLGTARRALARARRW